MKKFFAALSALAIMSLVAVGCKGKDPNSNPPKPTDAITVKKGGKDVTNLELSIGDKVAISTNAASNPEALIVNSSTGAFEVKAEPAGIVEVSKTEIVAKAAGDAKVIFSAGEAKVEVAVKVNKPNEGGSGEIKEENYYGVTTDQIPDLKKDIYVPNSDFSKMSTWESILKKAMTANGLDWKFKKVATNSGLKAFSFSAPEGSKQHFFGADVNYYYEGPAGSNGSPFEPSIESMGMFKLAKDPVADPEAGFFAKLPPLESIATLFGCDKKGELKEGQWKETDYDFGTGAVKMQAKKNVQGFAISKAGLQVVLISEFIKDFGPLGAQYKGKPGYSFGVLIMPLENQQSAVKSAAVQRVLSGKQLRVVSILK